MVHKLCSFILACWVKCFFHLKLNELFASGGLDINAKEIPKFSSVMMQCGPTRSINAYGKEVVPTMSSVVVRCCTVVYTEHMIPH